MLHILLIFFLLGCILLSILTLTVYKTKWVHKTRDASGHLKKKQSKAGLLIMTGILLLMISFFVGFQLVTFLPGTPFLDLSKWTSVLMLLLLLFDSFFIDLLLIGKIRPNFLQIPEETTLETMKEHVWKTFTIGWGYKLSKFS